MGLPPPGQDTVMEQVMEQRIEMPIPSGGAGERAPSSPATSRCLTGAPWVLRRRVLPQHTDHAGVMWHGAYLALLEEARVEALAAVGLEYGALSARGLELPVVSLSIDYRQALIHGEALELRSLVLPRQGLRWPWMSTFLNAAGEVAAEARVELVLIARTEAVRRPRLLRRPPADLAAALAALAAGPTTRP
jgi:acyl-CoA thioester hydrolase